MACSHQNIIMFIISACGKDQDPYYHMPGISYNVSMRGVVKPGVKKKRPRAEMLYQKCPRAEILQQNFTQNASELIRAVHGIALS